MKHGFKLLLLNTLFALSFSCTNVGDLGNKKIEEITCGNLNNVSYKLDVVPLLENNCYECHNEEDYAKKADGHKLFGYQNFKKEVDKGSVKGSILHETGYIGMPYRRKKLDTCDLAVIIAWIDQGAKEN